MAKYIDADALKDKIAKLFPEDKCGCNTEEEMVACDCLFAVMKLIDEQPAPDVAEVVHGHWIETGWRKKCSACGGGGNLSPYDTPLNDFAYCPWCGARMDGMDGEKE